MTRGTKIIPVILLTAFFMVLLSFNPSNACTSFAEYSDKVLFGNNFDYPDTPVKLNFYSEDGLKVFYGQFKDGDSFHMFCAMSNKGLFVPTQIQYPALPAKDTLDENEIYMGNLPSVILPFDKISQVRELLATKRLAPMQFPIHIMAADKYGDAVICEAGKEKNELTNIEDNFLVMTNFKNSDFIGKPYTEVMGGGADRYKKAYESIRDNFDGFDTEDAWDVLKSTIQTGSSSQTLMSSIFDPNENAVYFALKRNFDKVWKVSLDKGTIETYKGFDKSYSLVIPEEGLLAAALEKGELVAEAKKLADETMPDVISPLLIILAAVVIVVLPSFFLLGKKKFQKKG